jgi:predicted transcriptional regulator
MFRQRILQHLHADQKKVALINLTYEGIQKYKITNRFKLGIKDKAKIGVYRPKLYIKMRRSMQKKLKYESMADRLRG